MGNNHAFVICAYKESPFLEECILSLENQTIKSEIIIVTSTPNEFISEMAQRHGIEVFVNSHGGIVEDWNYAYKQTEKKYVTIAHQDDIYFPSYTAKVVDNMEQVDNPIICFTDYLEIREGKKVLSNRLLKTKRLMLVPLKIKFFQKWKWVRRIILAFGCPICCPSVTFSKDKVIKEPFTPGFRSDEDWEAWEKLSHLKGAFVYVPEILMGHRIHEASETTNILGDNAREQEDYIMFKKFWPSFIAKRLSKIYSISEKSNEL